MTLTLNQCTERAGSLSGELKAARELHSVCAADLEAKEHAATLARQAVEKAEANVARLVQERAELAEETKLAILAKGEPLDLGDDGISVKDPLRAIDGLTFKSGENVFESPLYAHTNGIDKAFDEATHP